MRLFRILLTLFYACISFALSSTLLLSSSSVHAASPQAIPTFHSLGLYWDPAGGSTSNECTVRYRKVGDTTWKDGFSLWYDSRTTGVTTPGYRGSLVHLEPNTQYDIELKLKNTGTTTTFTAKTWSENFPVGSTTMVQNSNQTLNITTSGTPQGYTLYTGPATIDVANLQNYNIKVTASYVIIRGLLLKGAKQHGIYLDSGVHDVVIENNDISGWGQVDSNGWGVNLQSAVFSNSSSVERIIVQGNKLHHPRHDTNSWLENGHPQGPQAITLTNSAGHHIFRYNEVYSDDAHYFNDIFGANSNFSYQGFPNRDSDIYGNYLQRAWDNPIESEGANLNVRIWGNFIDHSYSPFGLAATSVGPLYVFRNISAHSLKGPGDPASDDRGRIFKLGNFTSGGVFYGDGRMYLFHNTAFQPTPSLGVSGGIDTFASEGKARNIISRNNIFSVHKSTDNSIRDNGSISNPEFASDFNYDLYNGLISSSGTHEAQGIKGLPTYSNQYFLSPTSLGLDRGLHLANFNDSYSGQAPDMGAFETGLPALEWGPTAYQNPAPSSSIKQIIINWLTSNSVSDLNTDGKVNSFDFALYSKTHMLN